MRDPTFFRCVDQPHHRTGTRYKVYPTYDFACPIVDALEGVTHCLRTIEYHDRNAQYEWILNKLGLRKVHIYDYSRLCFNYTTLSKRKLQWFVDQKTVEGWHDPRFPTVQGVLRRGMQLEPLRKFIESQGASKATNLMSWDKIWAMNKQEIEPLAPRYLAVKKENSVRVRLTDMTKDEIVDVPTRPQDKTSQATRKVARTEYILLEGDDVETLDQNGEEVTLMNWGNAILKTFTKKGNQVTEITGQTNPTGSVKSTKKLNWIQFSHKEQLCPMILVEFDDLLNVPKLDENMELKDHVNPLTRVEVPAWGEGALKELKKGAVIQLMRRGFWIVDRAYNPDTNADMVLFNIPDGREVSPSILKEAIPRKKSAQPQQASKKKK